ncbi:hypothetical protein [Streptomyces sp. NPDC058773]|uniref:hypothetical protein n=1 Tax=Streptomyces sp. NPDC058773 TaxID=3346632 RepID=UPI0036CFAB19
MAFFTSQPGRRRLYPIGAPSAQSHICKGTSVMRFHRILATVGTVAALASVSACGLPSAGSPQEAGDFLKSALRCESIDIASPQEAQRVEAMGMTGINGGGECDEPAGGDGDVDFLTVEDMEAFQTAIRGDEDQQDKLMIGDDFVVDPSSDDQRRQLLDSGLMFLNCTPNFEAPDGMSADDGAIDGCFTTDYSEDLD